jgi:hypothetical protein
VGTRRRDHHLGLDSWIKGYSSSRPRREREENIIADLPDCLYYALRLADLFEILPRSCMVEVSTTAFMPDEMSMGRKMKVCLAEEEDDGAQTVQVRVPDLGFLLSTTPFLM